MRRAGLSFALAILSAAAAAAPADLPKRKPGLWEMKTSMVEVGGLGPTMHLCVGEQSDALLAQAGADDTHCPDKKLARDGERFTFDAVCRVEGRTAIIRARFSGDFSTAYRGEIHTTYDPPLQGTASTTVKQDGRWLGPCKPGQKPGDAVVQGMPGMGGGATFNIDEMMKKLPRAPAGR